MTARACRPARFAGPALVLALAAVLAGCRLQRGPDRPVPLPPDTSPADLIDADDPAESLNPLDGEELANAAERVRKSRKPSRDPEKKYEILCLSGGAVYGAYSAGVLVGWTQAGTRPQFDVVTGISVGATIAPFAFLGPEYDCTLQWLLTTARQEDVFTIRRQIRGLFSESVADNAAGVRRLESVITDDVVRRLAEEHRKGRRCYVGSTNLDTKRLVVWDLGAIAARGGPASRKLIVGAIVASASIPAFFPSVRVPVEIDGQYYEEMHVDGGVTRSMFFRPPYVPPDKREGFGPDALYGTNLYMLVAGKMYPDPEGVRLRTLAVAGASVSNLLYAVTRQDLYRMYLYAVLTGMNYYVSAIPPEFRTTGKSTDFDPAEMAKMFNEGQRLAAQGLVKKDAQGRPAKDPKTGRAALGPAWQDIPPGFEPGEELRSRTGLRLAVRKEQPPAPVQPPAAGPGSSPPAAPPPPVAK
ncbi:MAG: patatin-like phospholipase family protein [Gemmataceae bacterium]